LNKKTWNGNKSYCSIVWTRRDEDGDIDLLLESTDPHFDWTLSLQRYMEDKGDKKNEIVQKRN
jgi:hypothetical protein